MEPRKKADMLTVVAYGIHSEVHRRVEALIDGASADASAIRRLRPYFFYEYFLDQPVVQGEANPSSRAFAPFFDRILRQHDFIPVPPDCLKDGVPVTFTAGSPESIIDLANKGLLPTVTASEENIAALFPREHFFFNNATQRSIVLSLLTHAWQRIETARLTDPNAPVPQLSALVDEVRTVEKVRADTTNADDYQRFSEVGDEFFAYHRGVVSLASAFTVEFAKNKRWLQDYAVDRDTRLNAVREYLIAIYPWLVTLPEKRDDDRLFEIVACSISSHQVLYGELILIFPPLVDAEMRSSVYEDVRSMLARAATELYVPMLLLFENYAAEVALQSVLDSGGLADTEITTDEEAPMDDNVDTVEESDHGLELNFDDGWQSVLDAVSQHGTTSGVVPDLTAALEAIEMPSFFMKLAHRMPIDLGQLIHASTLAIEGQADQGKHARNLAASILLDLHDADGPYWSQVLQSCLETLVKAVDEQDNDTLTSSVHQLVTFHRTLSTALSEMERALVKLWAARFAWLPRDSEAVSRSLVFASYLIASPGMIKCIRQAMQVEHQLGKKEVKTTLVIGGHGSGKDRMAQLVRLFSPGYRFGEEATLNMAMFRPKEMSVPLLLGLRFEVQCGDNVEWGVSGIFRNALDQRTRDRHDNTAPGNGFTFVLDELNSLDIDAQGALLRVLENAELQPLGSIHHDQVNFLVVGIMNEDPHLIMKARTIERVVRDKELFGGILGETLYEMIRSQRRLRDDLYYRLIRGGEILVPSLKARRADIPILTYFTIDKDLAHLFPREVMSRWRIELAAYDELMSPEIEWEGNIRQLQFVCRRMVEVAIADFRSLDTNSSDLVIRARHARDALQSLGALTERWT